MTEEYRPDFLTKIVSSVIGVFSPRAAIMYQVQRQAFKNYAAGKVDGPNARWNPTTKTADEDFLPDKQRIVNRCRETARNDIYISGAIRKICTNVVRKGQKFQANITNRSGKLKTRINDQIEKDLIPATRGAALDITGHDSIYALQRLVLRTLWIDGQIFARRVWVPESELGFKIALLETDQLDPSIDGQLKNGNFARKGIEFYPDSMMAAAYHFLKETPEYFSFRQETIRVEAKDIIHVFDKESARQSQGVSWFVAVVLEAFELKEFRRYESIAAKASAAFAIFLKQAFPDAEAPDIFKTDAAVPDFVQPGRIQRVPWGTDIEVAKSDRPSTSFGPWTDVSLQGQSAGMNMAYGNFSGNRSKSSYSSERAGDVQEKYHFLWIQSFLDEKFNYKLWQWIIEAEQIKGLPVSVGEHGFSVEIQSPGWESIDQKKDAEAVDIKLKNGTTTIKESLAKSGLDYEETKAQRKREVKEWAFLPAANEPTPAPIAEPELDDEEDEENEIEE